MAKSPRAVTLKDVAERVGVSTAAVSMALAGHRRIGADTADRIRAVAAELGYVPSSAGKALRRQRSDAIALVVPNSTQHVFGHSYFTHVLTGVTSAANHRDVQVLVSTNSSEASGLTAYERVMRSRSADGAIVTSAGIEDPNIERLTASGLPVVLIGNYPELPSASSVGVDDVAASRSITEHLIVEHGRARLLHVTGPLDHRTAVDRRDGFLQAVSAHGLQGTSEVVEGDFSERSGAVAVQGRSFGSRGIDGVVFANDDMAFGSLQTLCAEGWSVPLDVAVVGFDDFGIARVATPSITTVRVPAEAMARLATERLFAQIEGDVAAATRDDFPVELVFRASCGCPSTPIALLDD